jgi:GNAT superfamily N-acetyltransferase
MDGNGSICKFLEWDTNFFGCRIGRANVHTLTDELLAQIDAWRRAHAVDCIYFLAEAGDPQTIRLAEKNRFNLVEVRLTFERSLRSWQSERHSDPPASLVIRPSQPEDIPTLQDIAAGSYIYSRFYNDPNFSEAQWQSFYRHWVQKSVMGGADLALTAEVDGEIVGYITGLVDHEKNEGIYELTGVKPDARRAGIGQELFRCGVDWYASQGIPFMWVATQGRNVPTQRMIQRFGFLTRSCELYYHKWFNE